MKTKEKIKAKKREGIGKQVKQQFQSFFIN